MRLARAWSARWSRCAGGKALGGGNGPFVLSPLRRWRGPGASASGPSLRGGPFLCSRAEAKGEGPPASDGLLEGLGGADARNRTADPFITSEVLCQLSYVGPK